MLEDFNERLHGDYTKGRRSSMFITGYPGGARNPAFHRVSTYLGF